jgi:hypothetical protein
MPQAPHYHSSPKGASAQRQPFYKTRTSLGAAGHWIREAGILAPLIISEFVKDPAEKWRYIRLASIATALVSQGMWTAKIHRERQVAREHELMSHSPG